MMDETEKEEAFQRVCDEIDEQNKALIERLDAPDFDPVSELDNTRNKGAYRIVAFFALCKLFPYGHVPTHRADKMVDSTDRLIDKIIACYGTFGDVRERAVRAGNAFRGSKRIWRIRTDEPMPQGEYASYLDVCQDEIFKALGELYVALVLACSAPHARVLARHGLTADFAAQALGIARRTLYRLEANPEQCKRLGYPGRDVDRKVFLDWATPIRTGKLLEKGARARARHYN